MLYKIQGICSLDNVKILKLNLIQKFNPSTWLDIQICKWIFQQLQTGEKKKNEEKKNVTKTTERYYFFYFRCFGTHTDKVDDEVSFN